MQQQQEIERRGGALLSGGGFRFQLVAGVVALKGQLGAQAAQFLPDAAYAGRAIAGGQMRLKQARNTDGVHVIKVILWRWLFNHRVNFGLYTARKYKNDRQSVAAEPSTL